MCEIGYEDNDDVETWRHESRTARKEHRCTTCGSTIRPGDRYESYFYVLDGDARSEKQCAACHEVSERFSAEHNVHPFPGSFIDFLEHCVHDDEKSPWEADYEAICSRAEDARAARNATAPE